ncbi:MAG TPA: LacI family DNA-binding transcriptional regulator [Microlunatus sp.]|nr:LacI family DNA-binding transcriptional regulator [Microlunatus sp.]
MGTIYDVARLAGVSTATVSRYLNGSPRVRPETAERIRQAIDQTGFVLNTAARSLTTKRTGLIGFVTSDLMNPFTTELAHAMTLQAGEAGLSLLTAVTFGDQDTFLTTITELRRHQVDGVIATPPETPAIVEALRGLARGGVAVVTIGISVDDAPVDFASVDTYHGGRLAVEHLTGLGHRRIGLITGAPEGEVAGSRYRAYHDVLTEADITIDPSLIVATTLDREGGSIAAARLLDLEQPPTAIFAVNDVMALGVIQQCHSRGIRVPQDLSVVGFDDIAMASHSAPPLTTVAQPRSELGRAAATLMIERLARPDTEPRQIRMDCSLVPRSSTAPLD